MSSGSRDDQEKTEEQQRNPQPIKDGKTWLRHRDGTMAASIDVMLLEGCYSVKEMAETLNERFEPKRLEVRIRKVKDHISHLQDGSDDSRRHMHAMEPHGLRLREVDGKWSFDID